MMIEKVKVADLYSRPGFAEMTEEYAQLSIKKLPKPIFRQEAYQALEDLGNLTVWCGMFDGKVIGFASCLLSALPKYGVPIAICESIFVRKGVRNQGLGVMLMAMVEKHARDNDMPYLFMSCPVGSEFERVLNHRCYSAETTTYVKSLL